METPADDSTRSRAIQDRPKRATSGGKKFYEHFPTPGQLAMVLFMPACLAALILLMYAVQPVMP